MRKSPPSELQEGPYTQGTRRYACSAEGTCACGLGLYREFTTTTRNKIPTDMKTKVTPRLECFICTSFVAALTACGGGETNTSSVPSQAATPTAPASPATAASSAGQGVAVVPVVPAASAISAAPAASAAPASPAASAIVGATGATNSVAPVIPRPVVEPVKNPAQTSIPTPSYAAASLELKVLIPSITSAPVAVWDCNLKARSWIWPRQSMRTI